MSNLSFMTRFLEWLAADPLGRLTSLGIALVLIVLSVRVLQEVISNRIEDREARFRTRKLIVGLGYFAFFMSVLMIFGPKMSNLAVTAGVASAGLAFALQEVIASFAGYIAISFGGFFRVGDRVELGGIRGDVIDISTLRTTLMEVGEWVNGDLYSGRIVRIANSYVFKEPVFNYSADFPFVWDEVRIPVRIGSDVRLAKRMFLEIANNETDGFVKLAAAQWDDLQRRYSIEKAGLEPMVTIVVNDNWIDFTIRYIVPFDKRRVTKDQFFEEILAAIEGSSGKVQFGSTTLDVRAITSS